MSWHSKAKTLFEQGWSGRQIADALGIGKSTVNDWLLNSGMRVGKTPVNQFKEGGEGNHRGGIIKEFSASKSPRTLSGRSHLVIADTQVKPSSDLTYLKVLGKYIADKKPEVIVHIGDHFDMESLSSYDRGKKSFEGRRVKADLDAGFKGMDVLIEQFAKVPGYNLEMVFTLGNHEERIDRFANDNPEFEGLLGTKLLNLEQWGWEVMPFLKPKEIDGIYYVHYLCNPFNGRPYGGNALNQLKTVGRSFVVGHKQCLDVAIRPTIDGKMQIGIVNGAYYPHFEDYKGFQGNNHFRGVTMIHEVKEGFGCPQFISLNYLMEKYK